MVSENVTGNIKKKINNMKVNAELYLRYFTEGGKSFFQSLCFDFRT